LTTEYRLRSELPPDRHNASQTRSEQEYRGWDGCVGDIQPAAVIGDIEIRAQRSVSKRPERTEVKIIPILAG